MKIRYAILAILLFSYSIVAAQGDNKIEVKITGGENGNQKSDKEKADTTSLFLGKTKILIFDNPDFKPDSIKDPVKWAKKEADKRKRKLTYWGGIEVGVNGYLTADQSTNLGEENRFLEVDYSRSRYFALNITEHKLRIIGDHVGLATGLGLEYNSYILKNDYLIGFDTDTVFGALDSTIDLSKNKLRTTYLRVPLLLEFNTSSDRKRSFHVSAGVIGGLKIGSRYKTKYERDGDRRKDKSKSHYHFNPFKADLALRFGYGGFNVFANYALTTLFEEDRGPELYPFSAGITLIGW